MIRKLLLIGLALVATRMARRAVRREAEVVSLLWTLIQVTAAAGTAGTAKSRSTAARVSALVPVVNTVSDTATAAQSTANTALSIVPANHSFLSTLSSATTGSVGSGAAAGGVPGISANVAGGVPGANAPFSGQCSVNPASQGYVNALADNVNAIRSDVISLNNYVDALHSVCYNSLRSDVVDLRNYVSAFAGTYNQTVSAVNHIQDQLQAHGFSST